MFGVSSQMHPSLKLGCLRCFRGPLAEGRQGCQGCLVAWGKEKEKGAEICRLEATGGAHAALPVPDRGSKSMASSRDAPGWVLPSGLHQTGGNCPLHVPLGGLRGACQVTNRQWQPFLLLICFFYGF